MSHARCHRGVDGEHSAGSVRDLGNGRDIADGPEWIAGRLDEARKLFEEELAEYERHAMYTVRQEVLCYLAELECRAGRWSIAVDLAAEAMDTVIESGQTATQSHVALFNRALPAAYLGHVDEARTWASEVPQR